MAVLVGCERSQKVTIELRKLGIEAYSCDIEESYGGHPEWHIQRDLLEVIASRDWEMLIAFPPCTHLASSGARWHAEKKKDGRQREAIDFFMSIANCGIPRIAIENPVGIMSRYWRKPDQIIHPYQFGDPVEKATCIWLDGLPLLNRGPVVSRVERRPVGAGKTMDAWMLSTFRLPPEERSRVRSETFPGIARAMAIQWGEALSRPPVKRGL